MRAVIGAGQASDLFNDLAEALKAGKLQGKHDCISRTPLVLDAEGQRNVKAIAERAIREVESEQQAVARRIRKANGDGGRVAAHTFALLAFEAAWEPADLPALAAGLEAGVNGAGAAV
jgi:capsid protein